MDKKVSFCIQEEVADYMMQYIYTEAKSKFSSSIKVRYISQIPFRYIGIFTGGRLK